MKHNSPIINSVAKLSIANPWSNCIAYYRQILNECDTMYDVSVLDIGRVWQAGLSNVTISNVNVLSEMLDIRNGFKTCNIYTMMMSTVLLRTLLYFKECTIAIFNVRK